jgi:hypothetical protein
MKTKKTKQNEIWNEQEYEVDGILFEIVAARDDLYDYWRGKEEDEQDCKQ